MISIDNHRKENGDVDWRAYNAAQVAAGEKCMTCGAYIPMGGGGPSECFQCRELLRDDHEQSHDIKLRCPKCRHIWNASDEWESCVYSEGEHDVACPECEHEFEVSTRVSYSFTSPKMEKENSDAS